MVDLMYDIPSIPGEKQVTVTQGVVEKAVKPEIVELKKSA